MLMKLHRQDLLPSCIDNARNKMIYVVVIIGSCQSFICENAD